VRAHRGHTARLGYLAQERQEPHRIRAGAVGDTVQVIAQRVDRALCEPPRRLGIPRGAGGSRQGQLGDLVAEPLRHRQHRHVEDPGEAAQTLPCPGHLVPVDRVAGGRQIGHDGVFERSQRIIARPERIYHRTSHGFRSIA
jgi:hypothetical protein